MLNRSRSYLYSEKNVKKYAPTDEGLYWLFNEEHAGYRVFYIGKTDNLQKRLLEHLNKNEPDDCIKKHLAGYAYFMYIIISSEKERERVEKEEVEIFNPTCNG